VFSGHSDPRATFPINSLFQEAAKCAEVRQHMMADGERWVSHSMFRLPSNSTLCNRRGY